jgi:hypothetical protein
VPRRYGLVKFGGNAALGHRVAYKLAYRAIPLGQCVMHTCDTPPASTRPPATAVRQIRERYVPRAVTMAQLAREFGITTTTVFYIVHSETWKSN